MADFADTMIRAAALWRVASREARSVGRSIGREVAVRANGTRHRAAGYGRRPYAGGYGQLTGGGITNYGTGAGTALDKTQRSFFTPTRIYWQTPLEVLCVESWAARNFIDIPIDDMFVRWRDWTDGNDAQIEQMKKAERRHRTHMKLAAAMKAARQYGTGAIVIMSTEAPLEEPLIPERIRPGLLKNLLQVNRYELSAWQNETDMFSPNYARPEFYNVHPHQGGTMRVHHSRVMRFDAITAATDSGFIVYDQDWGVSALIPVINALLQDEEIINAIGHLAQEASIPVLKVSQLRQALAGELHADDPDAPSVESLGMRFNQMKSNYRLALLDKEQEDFMRVQVQFAGLAQVVDAYSQRVAAAARIPQTRWSGRSPGGLNATGDSDEANYVMMVEAMREKTLAIAGLELLDLVVARDAGLSEPPGYEWRSLLELGEAEQAKVSKTKAEAVQIATDSGAVGEDDGRGALAGDTLFGALEGPPPEPIDPEPVPGNPMPALPPPDGDGG